MLCNMILLMVIGYVGAGLVDNSVLSAKSIYKTRPYAISISPKSAPTQSQ